MTATTQRDPMGSGTSAPAGVERLTALLVGHPQVGLTRARQFALVFFVVAAASSLPIVAAGGSSPSLRAAGAAAVAALIAKRVVESRRGGLTGPVWDLPEAVMLVLVGLPAGPVAAAGPFYAGSFFRALFSSSPRAATGTLVYVGAFGVSAMLTPAGATPGNEAAGHFIGLVFATALVHLLGVVLRALTVQGRSLAEANGFINAVLDTLGTGVVACDADGTVKLINPAARDLYGLPAEPRPGADQYGLYRLDGSGPLTDDEVPLIRALAGERVRDAEFLVVTGTGERRVTLANGQAIVGPGGERLGAVVALHDVTARREAEDALRHQALHDPLTGLANRLLLRDRLEHGLARGDRHPNPLALLFLDLDGFKTMNDSLGHEAGDAILTETAARLRSCLRPEDTAARLGGDEFAVLLEDTSPVDALKVAERILETLPVRVGGLDLVVGASIGIATHADALTADAVLRNADLAMYAAKNRGRGRAELFDPAMHHNALERLTLEAELRRAVEHYEFVVHYQPIVNLQTGRITALEALVRWAHPERGLVPPDRFIPLAEASGLIVPLGRWVLEEACRQAWRWQHLHPDQPAPAVTVNLSARQLQLPQPTELAELVAGALHSTGLEPGRLILEITEGVLVEHEDTLSALNQLRAAGVRLAIDDFGTGYSSLGRLRSFPVDKVKIDRSFIEEITTHADAPVVPATIALAHDLGIDVVAEGVETEEQLDFLRRHGCDEAQGHFLSRPLSADAVNELLAGQAQGIGIGQGILAAPAIGTTAAAWRHEHPAPTIGTRSWLSTPLVVTSTVHKTTTGAANRKSVKP